MAVYFLEYGRLKILAVLENASKPTVLRSDVNPVLDKTEKLPTATTF